jgi:hypothetical protein
MKKLFFALAITAFGAAAQAQTPAPAADPTDKKAPRFQFTEETHDFKTLKEGDPAVHTFVFKNVGKKPLIVTNASASCGCTVPEWGVRAADGTIKPQVIAPGKKGKVTVKYDTNGKSGPFNKSIWIESNGVPSPGQQRYEIKIAGTVVPKAAAAAN